MRLSKKLKKKLKKRLLTSMSSITAVLTLIAGSKLAGFPASFEKLSSIGIDFTAISELVDSSENDLSSESYINGIYINGQEYSFTKGETEYTIELSYDTDDMLKMDYIKLTENQEIKGETEYIITGYEKTITFEVVSEDKTNKSTYILNLKRSPTAYLKNIELPGYNLFPEYTPEETNYTISLPKDREVTSVNVFAVAWDDASNVTIQGQDNIAIGNKITITVTNPYITDPMIYTITYVDSQAVNNYAYKGAYEEFVVPYTGMYKFEVWGAKGGRSRRNGSLESQYGKGGYASRRNCLKKR